jgi:hypothetical protein
MTDNVHFGKITPLREGTWFHSAALFVDGTYTQDVVPGQPAVGAFPGLGYESVGTVEKSN